MRAAPRSGRRCAPLPALCVIFLLLGVGLPLAAHGQALPDTLGAPPSTEELLDDLDPEEADLEQLADVLDDLAENPLDVNTASADELAQIPAFGPALALTLVAFRTQFGPFASLPELQAVEGITPTVYLAARPYLRIGQDEQVARAPASRYPTFPSWQALRNDLRVTLLQRITRRLDLGRGYDADTTRTTYLGSPERIYTRARATVRNHLSLNLTLEKDPGERFGWEPGRATYGYDYVSAHAALHNAGRLRTLVVGDYVATFGQGLAFWRGSAFGKGSSPVRPLVRFGRGIIPYGSTDENAFFRGAAATLRITPDLSATVLASRRTLDANLLQPDTTAFPDRVVGATSLSLSGLHRTPSELADKDAVREDLVGGALTWEVGTAQLGLTGYRSRFDRPFQTGDALYQQFLFSGTSASFASLHGSVFLGDLLVFGEAGRAPGGTVGGLGGLQARLSSVVDLLVLARHFPRDFVSLHGYAFGERTGATQNETGYYLGLELRPTSGWRVAGYVDQYRFPWARFGVPRPSTGWDALLLAEHRPRRWFSYTVQGRTETREAGTTVTDGLGRVFDAVQPETRQSLRVHADYQFSRRLRVRARAEGVRFAAPDAADAYGVLLYQDIRWQLLRTLQADLRVALFDTDSYDARVYAYENDLLYTFAVPAFSGRGQRLYALLRWTPYDGLLVQGKVGLTRFEDVATVGSGLDEVDGDRLRDLKLQVVYRF